SRGVERLGSDEDLEAAGPRHALDELRLAIDLSVALYEKRNPDTFGGDRVGELRSFRNLVEVVGSEEHEPNSGSPRGSQARQCRLDRLAADFVAGDLDDRAEIAGVRTAARRINPEHRDGVAGERSSRRRPQHRKIETGRPATVSAVRRLELSAE